MRHALARGLVRRAAPEDARNAFTGCHVTRLRAWSLLVALCGGLVLLSSVTSGALAGLAGAGPAFWVVCVLLLLAELRPLLGLGDRDAQGLLVTPALVFAVLLLHGPEAAVVLQAVATATVDLGRGKALWRTAFNVGQYALSWAAAGAVLRALHHTTSPGEQAHGMHAAVLLPALAAGLAYFVVNQLLVVVALACKTGAPVRDLLLGDLRSEALSNGALLAMAPVVALAMHSGVAFVPLLLPPLVALYWVARLAEEREVEARTDDLTGLANRTSLREVTTRLLDEGESLGLLLLDLDRFKDVNDTLGHGVGDALLRVVARRLRDAVHPDDVVVRLGGDEFAVLLPGVRDVDAALTSAERLHDVLAAPVVLEGLLVDVGASVGVALAPAHAADVDGLLQRADVAMYQAKERGISVDAYDPARDRHSTARLAVLGELRQALTGGQLVLHYQPKADLGTRRVTGVEALVRWEHPERGLVPPDEFVPLAERSGLVQLLTRWVLETAVAQCAAWREQGLDLTVAVNVSVRDLCGGLLPDEVAAALARHDLPASALVLEVTEGVLFADPVRATATLERLADGGVALSLDDFGTGWSSLGHLRDLPVSEVKIDRSFVRRMSEDPRDQAIVRSVLDLAHGLGMTVVAEGVEDEEGWQQLHALGCGTAQGWHLSRPYPAEQLTPWLLERAAAWTTLAVPAPRREQAAAPL